MNTRAPLALTPLILALGLISGSAHAALQGRDLNGSTASFEAYYDTDLDITGWQTPTTRKPAATIRMA